MDPLGLEPRTYGLKGRYSTIELEIRLLQYTVSYRFVKSKTLVVGEGFEPPKLKTSDLQSDPVDHLGNPPILLTIAKSANP